MDVRGALTSGITDVNQGGVQFPIIDKFWIAYYLGTDVPGAGAFTTILGYGDWVMTTTHPQKKKWLIVAKKKVKRSPQWLAAGGQNGMFWLGYHLKFTWTKPLIQEFNSDANGSAPTTPQGPYVICVSNISPLAAPAGPSLFNRRIGLNTRTYFSDE